MRTFPRERIPEWLFDRANATTGSLSVVRDLPDAPATPFAASPVAPLAEPVFVPLREEFMEPTGPLPGGPLGYDAPPPVGPLNYGAPPEPVAPAAHTRRPGGRATARAGARRAPEPAPLPLGEPVPHSPASIPTDGPVPRSPVPMPVGEPAHRGPGSMPAGGPAHRGPVPMPVGEPHQFEPAAYRASPAAAPRDVPRQPVPAPRPTTYGSPHGPAEAPHRFEPRPATYGSVGVHPAEARSTTYPSRSAPATETRGPAHDTRGPVPDVRGPAPDRRGGPAPDTRGPVNGRRGPTPRSRSTTYGSRPPAADETVLIPLAQPDAGPIVVLPDPAPVPREDPAPVSASPDGTRRRLGLPHLARPLLPKIRPMPSAPRGQHDRAGNRKFLIGVLVVIVLLGGLGFGSYFLFAKPAIDRSDLQDANYFLGTPDTTGFVVDQPETFRDDTHFTKSLKAKKTGDYDPVKKMADWLDNKRQSMDPAAVEQCFTEACTITFTVKDIPVQLKLSKPEPDTYLVSIQISK